MRKNEENPRDGQGQSIAPGGELSASPRSRSNGGQV